MPKFVKRIVGGMEKITVAIIPGAMPRLKNMTDGIKYSKAGIVVIKSSIGVIICCKEFFCDIQIPKGIPIIMAINTEMTTSEIVSNVSGQQPRLLIKPKPISVNSPTRQFATHQAISARITIKTRAGGQAKRSTNVSVTNVSTSVITSKKLENVFLKKSTKLTIHSSNGSFGKRVSKLSI